jgi:hypothetical protein
MKDSEEFKGKVDQIRSIDSFINENKEALVT